MPGQPVVNRGPVMMAGPAVGGTAAPGGGAGGAAAEGGGQGGGAAGGAVGKGGPAAKPEGGVPTDDALAVIPSTHSKQ